MISSVIISADLAALKAAIKDLEFVEYESTVDDKHIIIIEAPSNDEIIGAFSRLRQLECVKDCNMIFCEEEPYELSADANKCADVVNNLQYSKVVEYWPSKLLRRAK